MFLKLLKNLDQVSVKAFWLTYMPFVLMLSLILSSPANVNGQSCQPVSTPYIENFDSTSHGWETGEDYINQSNKIPNCWSRTPDPVAQGDYEIYHWGPKDGGTDWENAGPDYDHSKGNSTGNFLYAPGILSGNPQDTAFITSPAIDLSSTNNPRAGFWYFMYGEDLGKLFFQVSPDSGQTWTTEASIVGQQQFSGSAPWKQRLVDLNAYTNDTIQIRFVATEAHYLGDFAIDDLKIEATPSCVKPANLQTANIDQQSVDISWNSNNSGSEWKLEWGPSGFKPGQGTSILTPNNPHTIQGLSEGTEYDVYVAEVCASNDTSRYRGPIRFTTYCSAFSAPYLQNFDSASSTKPFNGIDCWATAGNKFYKTELTRANTNTDFSPFRVAQLADVHLANGDTALIVSPEFSDLTNYDKRIRFHAAFLNNYYNSNSQLFVGAMKGRSNHQSFEVLDTIDGKNDDFYRQYRVPLNDTSIISNKNRLAFASGLNGGGRISIDSFVYEPIPACDFPDSINLAQVSENSAHINWTSKDDGSKWVVQWGLKDFNLGQGTKSIASNKPYKISGLNPGSKYDVYVAEICNSGDTSRYIGPFTFSTNCTPLSATYGQNFDNADAIDGLNCWYETGNKLNNEIRLTQYGYIDEPTSPTNNVIIEDQSRVNSKSYLVSSKFSDITDYDKRIRFQAAFENEYNYENPILSVGLMANRTNPQSFVRLDSITGNKKATYEEYRVALTDTSLVDTNQHLAFTYGKNSRHEVITIDDLVYEPIPECDFPNRIDTTNLTQNSATLRWNSTDTGSQWVVQWGRKGFKFERGNTALASNDTFTLNNLQPSTNYEVYVAEVCGQNDTSQFTGPFSFKTQCPNAFTADYYQGFDNLDTEWNLTTKDCWRAMNTKTSYSRIDLKGFGYWMTPYSEPNQLNIDADNLPNDTAFFVSPKFQDLPNHDKRIRFRAGFSYGSKKLYIGVMPDQNSPGSIKILDSITGNQRGTYDEYKVNLNNGSAINNYDHVAFTIGNVDHSEVFLDDIYYEDIPSCELPSNIEASQLTHNSVKFNWVSNGQGKNWKVKWGKSGVYLGNEKSAFASDTSYQISGLSPNTEYEFYVAEICGPQDTSKYRGPYKFTTHCQPNSLPLTSNFSKPSFPDCWRRSSIYNVKIDTQCKNGSHVLNISEDHDRNKTRTSTSPLIDGSNFESIKITYHWGNVCNSSGYSDDHIKFQWWDGNQWNTARTYNGEEVEGSFSKDSFLAVKPNGLPQTFKIRMQSNADHTDWQVDSLVIEEGPSCPPVVNLSSNKLTKDSAILNWNSRLNGSQWKIQWGQAGFNPGQGNSAVTSTQPFPIGGLKSNTPYDVYIAEVCGRGDTSRYNGPFRFRTNCGIRKAPITQSFNNLRIPDCMGTYGDTTWRVLPTDNAPLNDHTGNGGNVALGFFNNLKEDSMVLETGMVDISSLNQPELSFYLFSIPLQSGNPAGKNSLLVDIYDGSQWQNNIDSFSRFTQNWAQQTIDLSNYNSSSAIKARFTMKATADSQMYHPMVIDDIAFRAQSDTVTWYGTNDKNWNNATNWENGQPGPDKHVLIPKNKVRYPEIKNPIASESLIIEEINNLPTIENGNVIEVNGDLVNNGQSDFGGITIKLEGDGSQNIMGNKTTKVDTLAIANNQGVTIKNNVRIQGKLNLSNGVVKLPSEQDSIVIEDNVNITGMGDSSYIDGKVTKMGNDSFVFPLGNQGKYARLGISQPANTSDAFTAAFNNTPYSDTSSLEPSLNNVSQVEYWNLDRVLGDSKVDVTLYWENGSDTSSNITHLDSLRIAHWNENQGLWEDLGRDTAFGNAMSGRITVNNVGNFSPFTFGSGSSTSNPLPVELTDFTGQKIDREVKLTWKTASEQNASHFIVQRSTNEDQFEKIGRVDAQGTTTEPTQYRLLDKNPAQTNYYRLKQVDFDGSYEFSKVIHVSFLEKRSEDLTIYQSNESKTVVGQLQLRHAGNYQVNIRNSHGQLVYHQEKQLQKGMNQFKCELPNAAEGIYYLELVGNERTLGDKFLIR